MKCYALAHTRQSIPYIKELRDLFPSVTAVILAQQLDYWFNKYPKGFYKFLESAEGRTDYKKGDSWVEETGFTKAEFRGAFDKIGIRYNSASEFKSKDNPFIRKDGSIAFYCSVHNRRTGQTRYFRNHYELDKRLIELFTVNQESGFTVNPLCESLEIKNLNTQKSTKLISGNQESESPYTEITTKTTTEITTEITPKPPKGASVKKEYDSDDFLIFWEQYPRKASKPTAFKAWNKLKPSQEMQDKIMHDISWRKQNDRQWTENNGQFIPHPSTYLNQRRWEDESPTYLVQSKQPKQKDVFSEIERQAEELRKQGVA